MRKFDYGFLKNVSIPSEAASYLFAIARNRASSDELRKTYPAVFENLLKIARVQSVRSSNAIEGIVTTDVRIRALLDQSSEPLNHDEMEIAGYRDALDNIHSNHEIIGITKNDILELHRILLEPRGSEFRGKYKKNDNLIIESENGLSKVRHRPLPAAETDKAMEQMELAYYTGRQDDSINSLLLIPCYILDFLCIHPFDDGNGRMSRLLTILLLYKAGYDIGKYISFERMIDTNKSRYYESLKQSSVDWDSGKNTYWPFIEDFLMTLMRCYGELDRRREIIKDKKMSKAERVKETIMKTLGKISKEEIHEIWPDISYNTIELELSKLLKENLIGKSGSTIGAKYYRKKR